jgi:hypothetical protein
MGTSHVKEGPGAVERNGNCSLTGQQGCRVSEEYGVRRRYG